MAAQLTRRSILKALGIGTAALALEPILEPVAKKMWFVPGTAPVGSRIERIEAARDLKRALWQVAELDAEAMVQRWYEIHGVFIDEEVPFSAEDLAELQKPGRLRLPSVQTETTVDVVDLNEGSEWSFENGTRVRFGKGGQAYAARDMDLADRDALLISGRQAGYWERDMELADNYVRNLKIASGLPTIEISSLSDLVFSKS